MGKTLTMDLREGVTFHDGTPFDAEAVKANIDRSKNMPESRRKSEVKSIESVAVTGPYQVAFTLTAPDATLLAQFADRAGMMLSPTATAAMPAPTSAPSRSARVPSPLSSASSRTGSCWRNSPTTGTRMRSISTP
jgi:ABC-type transport system substrate-binding protein